MSKFTGNFYFIDGIKTPVSNADINYTKNTTIIYEVFKLINGIPLFIEKHLERLKNSISILSLNNNCANINIILSEITELSKLNNTLYGNIELNFVFDIDKKNNPKRILGFIPHKYPGPVDYIEGVQTILLQAERDNPNAKVKGSQTRAIADMALKNNNVYETVLVNSNGHITECSRSNIFFIKGNIAYSAPENLILQGITRYYVVQAIKNIDIEIKIDLIHYTTLNKYDAAFICGTSPGILPISKIDNYTFDTQNKVLRKIMQSFNQLLNSYMQSKSIL